VAGEPDQVVQLPQRLAEFASVRRKAGAGRLNQNLPHHLLIKVVRHNDNMLLFVLRLEA
jgi:hypothetical protein